MRILLFILLLYSVACGQTRKLPPIHSAGTQHGQYIEIGLSDPDVRYNQTDDKWTIYYTSHMGTKYSGPDNNYYGVIRKITQQGDGPIVHNNAPILSKSTGGWDSIRVETPCVTYDPNPQAGSGKYKLYYSGASEFHPAGFPGYNIGVAISDSDDQFWRVPINPILTIYDVFPKAAGGVVADPEVIIVNGFYIMFFSSYAHDADYNTIYYGISWAISPNGINWFSMGQYALGAAQPSVILTPMGYELYYTKHSGNELDNIPSTFNVTMGLWQYKIGAGEQLIRPFLWNPAAQYENLGVMTGVDVVWANNKRNYIYTAMSTVNPPQDFYIPVHNGYSPGTFYLLQAQE